MTTTIKALGLKEQNAIRDAFYQKFASFLNKEGFAGTRVDEGIVVSLDMADVVVKIVVKKERVDIAEKLAEAAAKEKAKQEVAAARAKKKAADEAQRAKAKAAKATEGKVGV